MVWFRFRMLRRYLAYASEESGRVYRMLDFANEGCPAHGPFLSWCRVLLNRRFSGTHTFLDGGDLGYLG